jgi:hypothetical protein
MTMDETIQHIVDYLQYVDNVFEETVTLLQYELLCPELLSLELHSLCKRLLVEAHIRRTRPGWHPNTARHLRVPMKESTMYKLKQGMINNPTRIDKANSRYSTRYSSGEFEAFFQEHIGSQASSTQSGSDQPLAPFVGVCI